MDEGDWTVISEEEGRTYLVEIKDEVQKVKGIGVIDTKQAFSHLEFGETTQIGSKKLRHLPPRLPEINKGMLRRAQTISAKDAGFFITRLGIGAGDRVLEAGLGSGGLSMHIARVLGNSGRHITVEPRSEHSEVGLENLRRCKAMWPEFPSHDHIEGYIEEVVEQITEQCDSYDAIILDMPQHVPAIQAVSPLLAVGGRIACYCPVTSQLENAWVACEEAGLKVEWAGELMERQWGKASKGGMRPVNGPFGHTAFLLVAQRLE